MAMTQSEWYQTLSSEKKTRNPSFGRPESTLEPDPNTICAGLDRTGMVNHECSALEHLSCVLFFGWHGCAWNWKFHA